MRVAQVNESLHLNSMGNLTPPTDQPTIYILGHPSRAGMRVGWMDKWTEVQRR